MCAGKKYRILLVIALFTTRICRAQTGVNIPGEKFLFFQHKLDSLPYYIKLNKINIYPICSLPEHSRYGYTAILTFFADALTLLAERRIPYINMYVLSQIASDFYKNKKYDSASWYWQKALDTAIKNHFNGDELHNIRVALNNDCFLLGDYTGAMKISSAGLSGAEAIGDENRMAHFNNVIGYIYMKLGNYSKSESYYNSFLQQSRKLNDTFEIAHALYNLGDLAISAEKYDKAIDLFNESLKYFISLRNKNSNYYWEREIYIANKLAQCWKLKGNPGRAMQFARALLDVDKLKGGVNEYDIAEYMVNCGGIYNMLFKPDSALFFLRKGFNIARSIDHREFKRDAMEQMAMAFSQKKIYDSAFFYQNLFTRLKDSIAGKISREEIYQREYDLQLERQQQNQKIVLQKQKFLRNIIIAVAVFLILIVIFLYNRYQLRQKNRYQKELNRQQIELFNAIAATQEQERKRIAQDIHDSLGSVLSAAKLKLAEAKELRPELGNDEKFLSGITLLDEASAELRTISHNIMPATLSKLGLVPALKNLSEKISTGKGLQVIFTAYEFNSRLDEQMEISIYRIILELINNIVKHAAADRAMVQLVRHPDNINISVEDNGKGFDFQKILQDKKGIGLGNVISRVEYMQGTIEIDTVPGRGTIIIIDIPWKAH